MTATDGRRLDPAGTIRLGTDGGFTVAAGDGSLARLDVPQAQGAELSALLGLRDTLLSLQASEAVSAVDTPQIRALRIELNRRYDAYFDTYGPINRFSVRRTGWVVQAEFHPPQGGFGGDPAASAVRALEDFDRGRNCATKAPIFDPRPAAAGG
jgi:hypothetical protein